MLLYVHVPVVLQFHLCDPDGCELIAHYAVCEPLKVGSALPSSLTCLLPTPVHLQLMQLHWQQVTVCAFCECQAVLATECERLITRLICLLREDAPPRHACQAPSSTAHANVLWRPSDASQTSLRPDWCCALSFAAASGALPATRGGLATWQQASCTPTLVQQSHCTHLLDSFSHCASTWCRLVEDTAWHPVMKTEVEEWTGAKAFLFKTFLGSPLKLWASVGHWLIWHFDLGKFSENQKPRVRAAGPPAISLSAELGPQLQV